MAAPQPQPVCDDCDHPVCDHCHGCACLSNYCNSADMNRPTTSQEAR